MCRFATRLQKTHAPLYTHKQTARMSDFKIYRLHEAIATNTDWHETGRLSEAQVQTIKDPADASYSIPITSIPSPFGRVFLVKNSFEKVNAWANGSLSRLTGETIYHRLVSETLDLAEMFFNFDNFKAAGVNLDILVWNKSEQLSKLRASFSDQHKLLARTLDLFWKDVMGDVDRMYIFRKNFQVIGGTSASTLFFTTPNEQNLFSSTEAPIKMGNDVLFDHKFTPLFQRDKHFQTFLYVWFEAHPILKHRMPMFNTYLGHSLKMLFQQDQALANEIAGILNSGQAAAQARLQQNYTLANVSGPGTVIMILPEVYWYKAKSNVISGDSSDFVVGSFDQAAVNTKAKTDKKPLLLQDRFDLPLTYWGGKWEAKTTVPAFDERLPEQRILPGMHVQYPYLTVSDFLEPYLMELPYSLNDAKFFDGNLQGFSKGNKVEKVDPDNAFLLPISRRFFDYFDAADLRRQLFDGTRVFTLTKINADSIKATLRLPIKANNQFITFERTYTRGVQPDLAGNKGAIVSAPVNMGFFPFLRDVPQRRVAIIERDNENATPYELRFYRQNSADFVTPAQQTTRSTRQKGHEAHSRYFAMNEAFDYIEVKKGNYTALLVPMFPNHIQGGKAFTFAVDFGTSNSHIEYAEGNSAPQPFNITETEEQIAMLHNPDWDIRTPREIQEYFLYEMIPRRIGSEFRFPTRTALAEIQDANFNGALLTFGDFNPALYYEKYRNIDQNIIHTSLKWGGGNDATRQKRVRAYIESLLMMMRNKVLINGGNISATRIIWFYPASMSQFVLAQLQDIWRSLHQQYFPAAPALVSYSESEAPYYHCSAGLPSIHPSINIDIGGGSTDVVVFQRDQPKLLTSFRFAGGALFGNAYTKGASLDNGFVKHFMPPVELFLASNYYSLFNLNSVFNQLKDPLKNVSADLVSFFFSLDSQSNSQIAANHLDFSFAQLLRQDTDFKVMYYLFFGAQMYHIAHLMKSVGLEMPQHIFFSGNGSRVLSLLDITPNWSSLNRIAALIFEKIYETPMHKDGIQVHRNDQPKEATCKGGIKKLTLTAFGTQDSAISNVVYVGDEQRTIVSETGGNYQGVRMKYAGIDNSMRESVVEEVRRCLRLLLQQIPNEFNVGNFGVPIGKMQSYYAVLDHSLDGFLQAGLLERAETTSQEATIEETLFFYPLIGALHRLGLAIANKQV